MEALWPEAVTPGHGQDFLNPDGDAPPCRQQRELLLSVGDFGILDASQYPSQES